MLVRPRERPAFNVFEVMHHGTHEKQLSNVFAWLLDPIGSHELGDVVQRIFIYEVNKGIDEAYPKLEEASEGLVPYGPYSVRQDVNTAPTGAAMDIADLVLESEDTVLVVENYFTDDPHGHSYQYYYNYGRRDGKRSVVVMLCGTKGSGRMTGDWAKAAVVTYAQVLQSLESHPALDQQYAARHAEQRAFLQQMEDYFVKESRVDDDQHIAFVKAMCETGEATRYGEQRREEAAIKFADALREQALDGFGESFEFLRRVKDHLSAYADEYLRAHLDDALDHAVIATVRKNYGGIYRYTVAFYVSDNSEAELVQIKFGPSAWFANTGDGGFDTRVPASEVDYTRLFVTHPGRKILRQSSVSLAEVLAGLKEGDVRLRDELLKLINGQS